MTGNTISKKASIPVTRLEHVALAVPDLDAAISFYSEVFGATISETFISREQGVRMAYAHLGNAKLELMEAIDEDSPIAGFIKRNPTGGIHHICLETENVDRAIADAGKVGLRVLGDGIAKPGHHGKKLFFLHPKDTLGALMEIEEAEK